MLAETHIAGLWCREVLARLGDYADGALDAAARAQVEAHVGACENCTRFGGRYLDLLRRLREAPAPELPEGLRERVLTRVS